jgi:site-specific recombinase XerD
MTIFEWLFKAPAALRRQTTAPLYNERLAFLTHMKERHRTHNTIHAMATHLLHINRTLGFSKEMRVLTIEELRITGLAWAQYTGPLRKRVPGKWSYEVFMRIARGWLRFNNCLEEPRKKRIYEKQLEDFEETLRHRFGLATSTIEVRSRHVSGFLNWISSRGTAIRYVNVGHVERYLDTQKAKGWALPTLALAARSLQKFFLHAEGRGWAKHGLSFGVPTYAIPRHAFVFKGPTWHDVQRLIASLNDRKSVELRDHAMLLLMAVYGLRAGDVLALRLTDVDFAQRILTVQRSKNLVAQRFPLNRDTLRTLRKYLVSARPISGSPAFFTTFVAPYERLRHGTLYLRVRRLFIKNRIASMRRGPHALRHACADRLMKGGHSISEIAAFLGHADTNTVREYARFDHKALRKIADFSLEGFL